MKKAVTKSGKRKSSPRKPTAAKPRPSSSNNRSPMPPDKGFCIAALGASAGGLEALEQFFQDMPNDSGLAFVIVQHLDPDHSSILVDLIKRHTRMPVFQVTDGMRTVPNHVYVIPPNKDLALLHGTLHLIEASSLRGLRLPIDYFFRSLAEDQGDKAVAIVLSGTGTDGTLGIKAIKEAGGMTMAQEEATAKYGNMPRSAAATGCIDYVLPPRRMPAEIVRYIKHPYVSKVAAAEAVQETHLQKIFIVLRSHTGHDFTYYKRNTIINRRIERRMAVHQIKKVEDYLRYLQQNSNEVEALFRELLIGVTNFFRDPESFDALKQKVLPRIFQHKSEETPIRVWVPGCSTGEEAYSIAMVLIEAIDDLSKNLKIQIFATDIDEHALDTARAGIYPESIIADVSPDRLRRFFSKEGHSYQINKKIRELLIFAKQDVLQDPPFSKLDLISCRNLLIYLDVTLQKRILPLFHYTLNPHAFLMLGPSETIGEFADLFSLVDKKWKIFQRKGAVRSNLEFPAAQAALEESRHMYADLYDFAPAAYFTFDRNGLILQLNLVGAELLGMARSRLIKRPFFLYIAEEDHALFRAHLKRAFDAKPLQTCEIKIKHKNGTRDVHLQTILAPDTAHEPQCRSIGSDVTARKQAEQEREGLLSELQAERARLETVLQQMPAGVLIAEAPSGKLISCNELVGQILRRPTVSNLEEYREDRIFHLDGRPYRLQELPLVRSIRTGEVVANEELDYLRGDDIRATLSVSAAPIRDANGRIVAAVATFHDITERKRGQIEMLKASKLESIGLLAGGIAHDFNNILTAIMGNISLSKLTLGPETDTYKGLAEAEKACLRAKGLTQQLLTFAKGGAPVTKTVAIAELLQDSIRFALHGSNVRCEISFPADLKPVEVDEGQIGQVINNLIINAQQAMPEGGTVTIGGKNVWIDADQGLPLPAGDYILLSVHDQGVGIPKEHLAKIFDPFYTTKAKGSGLGLATSYWIIKKHNGYITAQSELGAGTTFSIYLPASRQPLAAAPREESAPLAGEGKVLFLDDEPSIREFVGKMLTRFGYEVECAQEGGEAIERYRKAKETQRPFDVVVLDLTIPGSLGGTEVLQRLREIDPRVKAIVCSGYSNDPVLSDFKAHGFQERVAKPYQIDELSKKLTAVITLAQ